MSELARPLQYLRIFEIIYKIKKSEEWFFKYNPNVFLELNISCYAFYITM